MQLELIRNFAIIAHIDHGKSTLADRIMEECQSVQGRHSHAQMLDSMDLEKERGITIKAQTVHLPYKAKDEQTYQLNLIDTPGHVDFGYEVSRALASCEGALLVVDASSSVQAQTLANYRIAVQEGLDIIPVLNKIDLSSADIERCKQEIEDLLGLDTSNILLCSAKNGIGITDILESIVHDIKAPLATYDAPLKARIVDSWFDQFLGIVSLIRVYEGKIYKNSQFKINSTGKVYSVKGLGVFTPSKVYKDELYAGQVGFMYAGIKHIKGAPVGDTILDNQDVTSTPLPGFIPSSPKIYAGVFPVDTDEFKKLRPALEKLALNDSSLAFTAVNSHTLGYGFRCGFLGMLHLEIITERIKREYGVEIIISSPSVTYKVICKGGKADTLLVDNPTDMPPHHTIEKIEEPISEVTIITPLQYLGDIMNLCYARHGVKKEISYTSLGAMMIYEMPMLSVIHTFSDSIKSISSGYASFEHKEIRYQTADIAVLRILINDEEIDSLATFCRHSEASRAGNNIVDKLVEIIPRAQFAIKVQAALNTPSKIVARGNISAFRKNVTGKVYGGDRTRKMKLLEQQKRGKQKMKKIGRVNLPSTAFLKIFKQGD
jgi:GTP-binding protein LepA